MAKVVQGTNDSSTVSKYSMIMAGYDSDPYIKYFVHKKHRRTPLINLVYYVRWRTMTKLINHFCKNSRDLLVQVVSLGAGFDTTYFRIVANYNNFRYFEIDLPGVVKKKVEIIKTSNELLDEIVINKGNITYGNENEYLSSHKYTIFSHDLSSVDGLEMKLKSHGFECNAPTLVFSECALTYLEADKCTALISWIQEKFTRCVFATYEQINPDDAFGHVMTTHFKKIQTPLMSIDTCKTVKLHVKRFLSCGWHWCTGAISNRFLEDGIDGIMPNPWDIINREPFDEFEEWHLSNIHYALIVATKEEYVQMWDEWFPISSDILDNMEVFTNVDCIPSEAEQLNKSNTDQTIVKWSLMSDIKVERYGHSYLNIDDNRFLIVGGFGSFDKKHGRVSSVHHISLSNSTVTPVQILDKQNEKELPRWDCMYSTCTDLGDNKFVIYGGRTSPNFAANTKPWLCKFHWCDETKTGHITSIVQCSSDGMEPCPRWRHSAVEISPGKIVIYGGLTERLRARRVLNDIWLLTVKNVDTAKPKLSWSPLQRLVFDICTCSHSATVDDGTMYVSGGLDSFLCPTSRIFTFRLSEGWEEIRTVPQLRPRYGHTSHVTEKKQLLLVGGVSDSPREQPQLAVICLKNYNVIEYDLMPNSPEYPVLMLHNHISIYSKKENSVYIAGGGGNCFSFGTYFNPNLVYFCLTPIELNNLTREMEKSVIFKGHRNALKTYKEVLLKNPRSSEDLT